MPSYAGAFCRGTGPLGKIIDQTSPDLYRAAHSFVMSKIECQSEGETVNQGLIAYIQLRCLLVRFQLMELKRVSKQKGFVCFEQGSQRVQIQRSHHQDTLFSIPLTALTQIIFAFFIRPPERRWDMSGKRAGWHATYVPG